MKSENATIITQSTKESTIQHSEKLSPSTNNESFKVYIRIRPYFQKIIPIPKNSFIKPIISSKNSSKNTIPEKNMIKVDKNILYLEEVKNTKQKNNKAFIFDNVFNEKDTNETVFNGAIKSMIDKILIGYNSTALAYGVTGTGKTYTIFGDLSNNFKDEGIIFKACDYLFEKIEVNKNLNKLENVNYEIKVSYIEIYNEIVKDLINENSPSLMIVEDAQKGVICSNIKEVIINGSIQLKKIINDSNKRRTMASTDQNQFSSRSHAILQMSLEKKIKKSESNYDIIYSKFLVVDLAGSEKSMDRGRRREEGVNINKSLFTLGNCLNILSEKSNTGKFVPYRDSKLTRILKDSLGGNILTVMLACISPCSSTYDETLSTLNYAFKAKKITKKVMKNIQEININNLQYKEMIDNLKNEIFQLKQIIKNQEIKLKEKVDINNKENFEDNFNYMKDIKINESLDRMDTINMNNLSYEDTNIYENNKRTIPRIEIENKNAFNKEGNNSINDIDLDRYNNYIKDIVNNDLNIADLKHQIESIKKDKKILENHLFKENNEDKALITKYNSIKSIYDKYIEIVNEKLVENMEQNMIYNFNIKEITELNITNSNKVKELESQNEQDDKNMKIKEEIEYTRKNIMENNAQKEQIYQNIQENNIQKEELKKLLLNLFENKADYSNEKYIHIIHEKDKLSKMTKQYKQEIDNYVKMQKQKEEDMMKITRKIEILRAKLKEKDKKIFELEKKGGNAKYEKINIKLYKNKNIEKIKKNQTIKKKNSKSKNDIVKSPILRAKYNSINNKILINKNNKKNTSFNKNELTIFLNDENSKITKNLHQKQIHINNKTKTNENNILKYNELIIPTTTITLTENNPMGKENENPLFIKIPDKNTMKKTPDKNFKEIKKYMNANKQNYKRISSSNTISMEKFRNVKKKHSVKSVKVDFTKINNNKSDRNILTKDNSSDKCGIVNQKKIKIETNLINIKDFKAEKIKIDLTEIDRNNSEQNLDDKINRIKYLNLKTEVTKKNEYHISSDRAIKSFLKSNPKLTEKNKKINLNKRLSLQEARYENKLKSENISQPKNKLCNAELFINNYSKNKKNNKLRDSNKRNNEDKISVNTEPNIAIFVEQDSKRSFVNTMKRYKYKTYNDTLETSLDNK